ncbi:MAG TPA: 16S rRNA (cytosine(967)-C(5))-methyltransferase RsmB, partial [Bacilli bacterium]
RQVALDILTKVEQEQAYSNILLNQMLIKHQISRADAGLVTEIVYGTIQRLNTIDYFLNPFLTKGLGKLEPWVRCLLRMSFYQMHYLERIPEHAIVNEAVNIAKDKGHQGISGMVNGVLRNILRQKEQFAIPDNLSLVERLSLVHSHPKWMVKKWIEQYGETVAEQICKSNNQPPHVSIRVNKDKLDRDSMIKQLQEMNISAYLSTLSTSGIIVENGGNMALTSWYEKGEISIQDESSMLVADVVDPQPGMTVLDCCAAPGGKSMHMAEKMSNQGKVWANDVHEHKQQLIRSQAERLGLSCIETMVSDAKELSKQFADHSFDRILLDAPCSGLGVIRRKPDLKWTKKEADISAIAEMQLELMNSIQPLLRPGGVLVYSTCTLQYEENQAVIEQFLKQQPSYALDPALEQLLTKAVAGESVATPGMIQILPHQHHSDGFFIARLLRK